MDNNNLYNQDQQGYQDQQNYQAQQQAYQQPYQQPYQQVYQQPYQNENLEEPVSLGDWMVTMLIMMIPCVNIVMIFVYAFGNGKKSKSNYFKAALVWTLISIVLCIILMAVLGASLASVFSSLSSYYY